MNEAVPMMTVLEGGTDAGSMLIFDPATLPDDYDIRGQIEPFEIINELFEDGKIFWLNTASDGGFSLGVVMGDRPPSETAEFARSLETVVQFNAPSGKFCFTGIEYAFRHDNSRLRKYPHMGACREVPTGIYRLTLYEMEYPAGYHEILLQQRLPADSFRLHSLMDRVLIPLGLIGGVALALGLFALRLRLWIIAALPLGLASILPALLISRSKTYREASRLYSAIKRDYPDYLATLELVADDS